MLVNDRRILGEVEVLEVAALDGSWHIDFVGIVLDGLVLRHVKRVSNLRRDWGHLVSNEIEINRLEPLVMLDVLGAPHVAQSAARIAREQRLDEALAVRAYDDVGGPPQLVVDDAIHGVVEVGALEGRAADEHLVDEDAKGPPVDGGGLALSLDDFGRNVLLCPNKGVCGGRKNGFSLQNFQHAEFRVDFVQRALVSLLVDLHLHDDGRYRAGLLRQVKVRQRNVSISAQQQVLGLQVAIHKSVVVKVLQRKEHLRRIKPDDVLAEPPLRLLLHDAEELAALTVLHDEAEALGCLERAVHRDDEGVV
mmetsp:Transcript_7179/g.18724  ORF Transcript_7179/g.18724 Transcript_7179/m.18724 type:complete len:307 (+) Transcript_7179:97-1017(+)